MNNFKGLNGVPMISFYPHILMFQYFISVCLLICGRVSGKNILSFISCKEEREDWLLSPPHVQIFLLKKKK